MNSRSSGHSSVLAEEAAAKLTLGRSRVSMFSSMSTLGEPIGDSSNTIENENTRVFLANGRETQSAAPPEGEVSHLHYLCEVVVDRRPQACGTSNDIVEGDENSGGGIWTSLRNWMNGSEVSDDPHFFLASAEHVGEFETTPLHLVCGKNPPVDVVQRLLRVAPETARKTNMFGWLPLHYACANCASLDVLRLLVDAHPDGRKQKDKRGRTPLHFAIGNRHRLVSADMVRLLASSTTSSSTASLTGGESGAARLPDENGRLPLHYACLYGISEDALSILTKAYPDSIVSRDNTGRTPLHLAMSNADKSTSPLMVQHILSENKDAVFITDKEGHLPLHLMSNLEGLTLSSDMQYLSCSSHEDKNKDTSTGDVAGEISKKSGRVNARECLRLYLNAEPPGTVGFITALQGLPVFLHDMAVVTPFVQCLLNRKISRRFPTIILMLDFYCNIIIIVCFRLAVQEMAQDVEYNQPVGVSPVYIWLLFVSGGYFLAREVAQLLSLAKLGLFKSWVFDMTNVLDVICLVFVFTWTSFMAHGATVKNPEAFRSGAAAAMGFFFLLLLSFLKSTLIDFAVFVGGVFYVVRRMVAFLIALVVILIAFALMFVTVSEGTCYCVCQSAVSGSQSCITNGVKTNCGVSDDYDGYRPFCSFWSALLKVYTMLMGEVDETDFSHSIATTILFAMFMFLVVILLANVLIAIVTDSYGVIKNQRAQIVFWSNRLDFVAEMDVISSGRWWSKMFFCQLPKCLCTRDGPLKEPSSRGRLSNGNPDVVEIPRPDSRRENENSNTDKPQNSNQRFGRRWHSMWKHMDSEGGQRWEDLKSLYDNQDLDLLTLAFLHVSFLRVFAIFAMLFWFVSGVVTAGMLWPPQVREWLFVQRTSKARHDAIEEWEGEDSMAEHRDRMIMELRGEVQKLRAGRERDRNSAVAMQDQLTQLHSNLAEMKFDVSDSKSDMKQIKEILEMMVDIQTVK